MLKKIIFFAVIAVIIIVIAIYTKLLLLSKPTFCEGARQEQVDSSKPRILLASLTGGVGGIDVHVIKLYRMLRERGYYTSLLVPSNTQFSGVLQSLNLPHYTTHATIFHMFRPFYHFILRHCLYALCKVERFDFVHCNNRHEAPDALKVKNKLPIHVLFTRHMPDPFAVHQIKNIDTVIAVGPLIQSYFETENRKQHLNIGTITYIPPLFEPDKFSSYIPKENRPEFFKKNFGLTVNNEPVIIMIAQFYPDLLHKNHPLLLHAIRILVHQKNKPVTVMLAGDGASLEHIQKLAKDLGLEQYIHFLGNTKKIPDLLHHSDMMVLTSKKEAFGIVYLEAALMKKPAIGATGTGAQAIILDERTGLLFKNNDAQDLANQIERLIDNPEWAQELGNNAYTHVTTKFCPEVVFEQYEELYKKLERIV